VGKKIYFLDKGRIDFFLGPEMKAPRHPNFLFWKISVHLLAALAF